MLETKPTEMKDIGVTYNNLCKLLVEIEETINPPKVEEITKENNAQDIKNIKPWFDLHYIKLLEK